MSPWLVILLVFGGLATYILAGAATCGFSWHRTDMSVDESLGMAVFWPIAVPLLLFVRLVEKTSGAFEPSRK